MNKRFCTGLYDEMTDFADRSFCLKEAMKVPENFCVPINRMIASDRRHLIALMATGRRMTGTVGKLSILPMQTGEGYSRSRF